MPTQKVFKQRVRTRMSKTGEAYTAARLQLLNKTADATPPKPDEPALLLTSDDAMLRGTGKRHEEWFALLDTWGATERKHPEIATWLRETQEVAGWWAQNITVAYERARGMRGRYQMVNGFSIGVTRTIAADPERILVAFTSAARRKRWLPDHPMRPRPTRAALTARFDWSDPPSRVVVTIVPKGADKAIVAVGHEQLPDPESAERFKVAWREWLGALKADLERG